MEVLLSEFLRLSANGHLGILLEGDGHVNRVIKGGVEEKGARRRGEREVVERRQLPLDPRHLKDHIGTGSCNSQSETR